VAAELTLFAPAKSVQTASPSRDCSAYGGTSGFPNFKKAALAKIVIRSKTISFIELFNR